MELIVAVMVAIVGLICLRLIHQGRTKYRNKFLSDNCFSPFAKTIKIGCWVVLIDEIKKQIAFCDAVAKKSIVVDFGEILGVEILEDGATIIEGGIGRAIVGGVLAGGVGAIIGATTRKSSNVISSLKIRIITSNISNPMVMLDVIGYKIEKSNFICVNAMKSAQEVYSTIISIIEGEKGNQKSDVYGNLEKLSKLRDNGIITAQEFNEKKKILLDTIS